MSETVTRCSRCDAGILSDPSRIRIESDSLDIEQPVLDLCPHCTESFRHWFQRRHRHGSSPSPTPTPTPSLIPSSGSGSTSGSSSGRSGSRRRRRSSDEGKSSSRRHSSSKAPKVADRDDDVDVEDEDERFRSVLLFSAILGAGIIGTVIVMILLKR